MSTHATNLPQLPRFVAPRITAEMPRYRLCRCDTAEQAAALAEHSQVPIETMTNPCEHLGEWLALARKKTRGVIVPEGRTNATNALRVIEAEMSLELLRVGTNLANALMANDTLVRERDEWHAVASQAAERAQAAEDALRRERGLPSRVTVGIDIQLPDEEF